MSPTQGGMKKKAMLPTRNLHTRLMCRSLMTPVMSSRSRRIMLMTLAGKGKGRTAEMPSESRQIPKIMASSLIMVM